MSDEKSTKELGMFLVGETAVAFRTFLKVEDSKAELLDRLQHLKSNFCFGCIARAAADRNTEMNRTNPHIQIYEEVDYMLENLVAFLHRIPEEAFGHNQEGNPLNIMPNE